MSVEHVLQLVQLLAVPGLGLLWRISHQLAALTALQADHARRLQRLEDRTGQHHRGPTP